MFYNPDGEPIDVHVWGALREDFEGSCRVAEDTIGDAYVSTAWIGIDLGHHQYSPPLIFETMVFGGRMDMEVRRAATREQALAVHQETVGLVRLDQEIHQAKAE